MSVIVKLIPITDLSAQDVEILVGILNTDCELNQWLRTDITQAVSPEEFIHDSLEWMRKNQALTYCIYFGQPVGEISISHITPDSKARIGYWIASRAWNRGIGSQAFARVLDIARSMSLNEVSATIETHNHGSLHMWRKYGAQEEQLDDGKIKVRLQLD